MPKGPKFKQGFTWRHHFDEWWDRRPHEWKIRLFVWSGFAAVLGIAGIYFWMHQRMEREELLAEAGRNHRQRIADTDKALVPVNPAAIAPSLRDRAEIQTRPAD